MPLQIMGNIYPASWFYLSGHCYVRSMFVKRQFLNFFLAAVVAVVVGLFAFVVVIVIYLLLLLLFFNWYQLDCNFLQSYVNFFQFQIKC